jgi:rubrerythrin
MPISLRRHLVPAVQPVTAGGTRLRAAAQAAVAARPLDELPEEMSWHDYAVYLLHAAAEVEHALMVQYLYAAYSLGGAALGGPIHDKARSWREVILGIAKEEMGHLITVQNVLRVIGGPLHLEREDYPFRSDVYPFHFVLEPLSKNSLAKYVVAESPEGWEKTPAAKEIVDRAMKADDGRQVVTVGELYRALIAVLQNRGALRDEDFLANTEPYQAAWDEWGRGYGSGERGNVGGESPPTTPDVLVIPVRDRATTLAALHAIARQGEAPDPTARAGSAEREQSHFARFLKIYEVFPDRNPPSRDIPTNPTTDPDPEPGKGLLAKTPITNPTSVLWAHLFNVRYRKLLFTLKHALHVEAGADLQRPSARGQLIAWTFGEMYNLRAIAGILVTLPLGEDGGEERAAPAFEAAYTLTLPDWDSDKWRVQRDLVNGSERLIHRLQEASPDHLAYLRALRDHDKRELQIVEQLIASAQAQEAAS